VSPTQGLRIELTDYDNNTRFDGTPLEGQTIEVVLGSQGWEE